MESESTELFESDITEALDARVFNPPRESEESAPASVLEPPSSFSPIPFPEKPTTDPDPLETGKSPQQGLPPPAPSVQTGAIPKTTQPKTPVVPHLPSRYAQTYELEKFSENRMIIFNHDQFLKANPRPGTLKDEEYLRTTLGKFRFKIDPTHKNLKKKELIDTVKNFALKTNFSRYGCVCVVIMTHGYTQKSGYLLAYDQPYNEHEIYEHFDASKNPSLAAKPVIFLIQACRGAEPSPIIELVKRCFSPVPELDDGGDREFYHLPMDADRVVFHSAYIGRASVRHPLRGSWFIQTLCKLIDEHALTLDLEIIFRLVKREIALDCVSVKDWKQMPVVSTTTIREIRLAPNIYPPAGSEEQSKDMVDMSVLFSNVNLSPPKEPRVPKTSDETPDDSLILAQTLRPHSMPCSCFLEYFEYLKTCLRSFVHHNAEDGVAINLLTMAERAGDGAEYNLLKFSLIESVWDHFQINIHMFPPDGYAFIHRLYH
ncbi:hypothetical protein MSG28_013822 [Choristoneura fumiferana]|uniref:Uncharacterized protein n=1 Tax=Choristoneura fumiferana TaxID=7141 RepID=A0ACC0K900_CHOFU|nr:hypothetical protein MSG28_013822 [Choristoneura fumiferana]